MESDLRPMLNEPAQLATVKVQNDYHADLVSADLRRCGLTLEDAVRLIEQEAN